MENGNGNNKNLVFDEFNIETELQMLRRDGEKVHLAKRPFAVLLFLIENRERVVSRDELLQLFWDGHDVYDDALRKCVGAIRKALDDTEKLPRFIETRRGSGYRFVGAVLEEAKANGRTEKAEIEEVGGSSWQLAGANGDGQPKKDKGHETKNKKQTPLSKFISHPILISVVAVSLISIAALAFTVNRRPAKNVEPRTLTEAIVSKRSIAILPLKNLTGDPANDYLSDGITESLINEVSRIESLKVISRSSVFQFKNKDTSAQEIGERLGVETILEGGLRRSGDQFRVDVRLVNTKDGSVTWANESEQTTLADIFAIQNGIANQIAAELKLKQRDEGPRTSRYTRNVKAYQLYLQGLYQRNQLTKESMQKAVGFYQEALSVEPNYALAHEGLAGAYAVMELNSHVPAGSVAPKAEFHAQKALELDDGLADAYVVLGAIRTMKNYDLKTREDYYNLALRRNPNHRTAHLWLANNFTVQGKFEEAEREILRVQELDPLSFGVRVHLFELYYYWRKPDKAIEQAELMLVSNPENKGIYGFLAKAYAQKNEFDKAFATLENLPPEDGNRVLVLASAGRGNEARRIVETLAGSGGSRNPFWFGCMYAAIGERETAFAWLEKSYKMRQADLVSLKIDPALDNIRDDARYSDLLQRVGLSE